MLHLNSSHQREKQWHPLQHSCLENTTDGGSLAGYSPWGHTESDTTERLPFHFSLSCTGEGNGNPLQGSCLEYPRDGGAWWAAVCGVTWSQTQLKWLSSSSSSSQSLIRDSNHEIKIKDLLLWEWALIYDKSKSIHWYLKTVHIMAAWMEGEFVGEWILVYI